MKKPIYILTAIVLAGITTANANTNTEINTDNKALSKALKCTRSFVQTDTPEGERSGYIYLQKIRDAILNNQDLNAIAIACKKDLNGLAIDQKTNETKIDPSTNAVYPENLQNIVTKFKYSRGQCRQVSVGVDAALLVNLGVGVSGGFCRTDDGRRWIDAGLYADIGVGVGVFADAIAHKVEVRRDPERRRLVDKSDLSIFYWIVPIVGPVIGVDQKRDGVTGIAVGLGAAVTFFRGGTHARIIPLKNDWSEIVSELTKLL